MCVNFDTQIKLRKKCELTGFNFYCGWKGPGPKSNHLCCKIPTTSAKSISAELPHHSLRLTHTVGLRHRVTWFSRGHVTFITFLFFRAFIPFSASYLTPWLALGERESRVSGRRSEQQTHAGHQGTAAGVHVKCWIAQLEPGRELFERWQPRFTGTARLCLAAYDSSGLGSWNKCYCGWTLDGFVSGVVEG